MVQIALTPSEIDWKTTVAFIMPALGGIWALISYSFSTRETVRFNTKDIQAHTVRIEKLESHNEIMQKQLQATEALAESMKDFKSEVKDNFVDLRGAMLDMAKSQSNIEGYLNRGGKIRKEDE